MLKTFVKIRLPLSEAELGKLLALNAAAKNVTLPMAEPEIIPPAKVTLKKVKSQKLQELQEPLPFLSIEDEKHLTKLEQGTLSHGETPLLNSIQTLKKIGRPIASNSPKILAMKMLSNLPQNQASIVDLVNAVAKERPDMPRCNIRSSIEKLKRRKDIEQYQTSNNLQGLRLLQTEASDSLQSLEEAPLLANVKSVSLLAKEFLSSSKNKSASIDQILDFVKSQRPDLTNENSIRTSINQACNKPGFIQYKSYVNYKKTTFYRVV